MMQKIYSAPIKDNISLVKESGQLRREAPSAPPPSCRLILKNLPPLIVEAGADLLFVQSTVTTTRHVSKSL